MLIAAVMHVIIECKFENVNGVPGRKKIINEFDVLHIFMRSHLNEPLHICVIYPVEEIQD